MKFEKLEERSGLSEKVLRDIQSIAKEYHVKKITLFGSRARGTNQEKSDIDLAIYGCTDFDGFSLAVEEEVWTLLEFDVIDMDHGMVSEELKSEIERDGIVIYEKI